MIKITGVQQSELRLLDMQGLYSLIPKLQRVGNLSLTEYIPDKVMLAQVILNLNQDYMHCKTYILQNSDYHNVSLKQLGTRTIIFTINFNFNLLFR